MSPVLARTGHGEMSDLSPLSGVKRKSDFVTHDAVYVVLDAARPECDWPDARIVDVQISRLRRALRLDSSKQDAALETAKRKIAEVDAAMTSAESEASHGLDVRQCRT